MVADRVRSWAAGLAGVLGLASPTAALAQSLPPEAAPAAWVEYAEAATAAVSGWLSEDGKAASRLRLYLYQTLPTAQPARPLELRLWISPEGIVSRVGFDSLSQEEADADLLGAVQGRRLSPPPVGMLQPLRLAIQLDPAS